MGQIGCDLLRLKINAKQCLYCLSLNPHNAKVRANHVLLGATRPKTDMTTASVEESFYIKTERNPRSIKLKFHLKDQDHMTDDDLLGHVST